MLVLLLCLVCEVAVYREVIDECFNGVKERVLRGFFDVLILNEV